MLNQLSRLEIYENVRKSEDNRIALGVAALCRALKLESTLYQSEKIRGQINERIKAYYAFNRNDGHGGTLYSAAVFFDEEIVGAVAGWYNASIDSNFDFVSHDAGMRVREFLVALEPKINFTVINDLHTQNILPATTLPPIREYRGMTDYMNRIKNTTEHLIYNDKLYKWKPTNGYSDHNVILIDGDIEFTVSAKDVLVPYHLNESSLSFIENEPLKNPCHNDMSM